MSRITEKGDYNVEGDRIPIKWCAPEILEKSEFRYFQVEIRFQLEKHSIWRLGFWNLVVGALCSTTSLPSNFQNDWIFNLKFEVWQKRTWQTNKLLTKYARDIIWTLPWLLPSQFKIWCWNCGLLDQRIAPHSKSGIYSTWIQFEQTCHKILEGELSSHGPLTLPTFTESVPNPEAYAFSPVQIEIEDGEQAPTSPDDAYGRTPARVPAKP